MHKAAPTPRLQQTPEALRPKLILGPSYRNLRFAHFLPILPFHFCSLVHGAIFMSRPQVPVTSPQAGIMLTKWMSFTHVGLDACKQPCFCSRFNARLRYQKHGSNVTATRCRTDWAWGAGVPVERCPKLTGWALKQEFHMIGCSAARSPIQEGLANVFSTMFKN